MIRLADGLTLPVGAATETFLVVGKRGSGKSSTATRLAEQLMSAKVPIAVLDPVDVWWGLKAGGDGNPGGGFPVYVFGGEHANLPLEATAGTLMADTLVDHRINAVFVLRQFSNRDKARFVSEFAEQLYKRNRDAMHLFCEEAHELMPQNPYGGEEEMLGRMIRIAKLGRTSGIGVSAITQRPASLSKNFTTQAEVLVAHRITGPQDRDAIEGWIKHHNVGDEKAQVLESLPTLKTGEAWFWAPDFPEDKPVGLRRVQVLMPETFDSRRTPKPGEKRKEPKALAAVDLEKLGEKMAATRKRAEENDPGALRREVMRLRAELAKPVRQHMIVELKPKEILVLKDAQITRLERVLASFDKLTSRFSGVTADMAAVVQPVYKALVALSADPSNKTRVDGSAVRAARPKEAPTAAEARQAVNPRSRPEPRASSSNGLPPRQKRILDVLATLDGLEIDASRDTLAAWVGSHPNSKGFSNDLSTLRTNGYVEQGTLALTGEGGKHADPGLSPATLGELMDRITKNVPPRQRRMLELILETPDMTRDELAAVLGAHPNSKGYSNDLSALRSRGLVKQGSPIRPADFFAMVAP